MLALEDTSSLDIIVSVFCFPARGIGIRSALYYMAESCELGNHAGF